MKYSAVIAAAGISSRMYEFKPMLCLGDHTMIASVIQNFREAGVHEIVVVTGYKSELLNKHLNTLHVRVCENERYAETKMYDSLRLGLQALKEPYDYVFMTPGDVPLVQPKTILKMQESRYSIVRPVYDKKPGHPVMLSKKLVPDLLCYHGKNGLKGAIESFSEPVLEVEVDDAGVLVDVDTPADLKALYKKGMLLRNGGQLWPDIQIHIAKENAILTPETVQYLEMIGHTGSIQNACACMHMSYTRGWKLLNQIEREIGYPLVERYPGGTSGGGTVLTAKGRRLITAYQLYREELLKAAKGLFQTVFEQELNG